MSLNTRSAILSIAFVVASFAGMYAAEVASDARAADPLALKAPPITKAPGKEPFKIQRGDCALTIGGKARVEQYFQPHINLLNKHIPDEAEYFKQTIDLNFAADYGQKKYGYKAAEIYFNFRNKGVWGRPMSAVDKDSGPIGTAGITLSDTVFGAHSHSSVKPLVWMTDAWLSFAWNAALNCESEKLHNLKVGWFGFQLGRGIALGSAYGVAKESLGMYSFMEDKSAPGILAHGELLKDNKLSYDLYYSRLEERCKGMSDSISLVKGHWVDRALNGHIWRGVAKQNDLVAARLQWKPVEKHEKLGSMHVEPYVFYNAASDQKVDIAPDSRAKWGSYGLMFEHSVNGFEYGAEVAFNYGTQHMYNIDRNQTTIKRDDTTGVLTEYYTNIFTQIPGAAATYKPAVVKGTKGTTAAQGYGSMGAAYYNYTVGRGAAQNTSSEYRGIGTDFADPVGGGRTQYFDGPNKGKSRFRPAYDNDFHGWMGVADMAYTFKAINLQVALSYAYASGDGNPHDVEKNKRYHGFVGLHEWYSGKRVFSMMMLDDANIVRPTSLEKAGEKGTVNNDYDFTDLQMVGIGATWKPKGFGRDISISPNLLGYWKAFESYAFDASTEKASNTHARRYLGTELNLATKVAVVQDLMFFGNFGVFKPGAFYSDMKGVPLGDDKFGKIVDDPRNGITSADAANFRLGDNVAFHLNCGIEYRF